MKMESEIKMSQIEYREMSMEECDRISEIDPSQYIGKAWREVEGERLLVEINYLDNDWPNGYDYHYSRFKETLLGSGAVWGAFSGNRLIGFATLNRAVFGTIYQYVLLDQLFISRTYRNKGIGKSLFLLCAETARQWRAEKIYLCAGSAEETIAFYYAIGCKEAMEINEVLYADDPRDLQLEYTL